MRFTKLVAIAALSFGICTAPLLAHAADLYYTMTCSPPPIGEILAITVSEDKITTTDIGSTGVQGCASPAMSSRGTLYSMCGPLFGAQQLTTIDLATRHATFIWHADQRAGCHGDGVWAEWDAVRGQGLRS